MIIDNPNSYEFVMFEKGRYPKKYNAVLRNKETGRMKRVPFGQLPYQQFYDSTGLNLYTHLNHGDKARRRLYYDRHGMSAPLFSSKYFSHRFLW
jgi:hypothetical protein